MSATRGQGACVTTTSANPPATGGAAEAWVRRLDEATSLDGIVAPIRTRVAEVVGQGRAREVLGGAWLGHAAHPMLTDVPIGCWTSANVLDLIGGRASRPAAQRLVGLGVLSAIPTVLTGASDWSVSTDPRVQRVGLVHAAGNKTATVAYLLSWLARRRGRHVSGVAWALLGTTVATGAGYLGGHLSYSLGSRAGETVPLEAPPPLPPA